MHATIDRTGLPAETKLGIQLRGTDDGVLVIDMLSAGGLAEQIGELQNGDRILAINGNDVVGIPRNVIVGWLYEHDKTVVHYERDGPASTPSPPKMTMKERLKARAHRDSVNRGLPTGPVPSNTLGSRKTSLKTRLQSRRIEAEGKPEPASPPRAEPNFTTPPESPNGLNTSLPVSPSVIILGSSQTVEGIGAVHVIQLVAGAVEGFELADASDDPSHPDFASHVWVHSVEHGSEVERQGMAVDDVVLAVNGQNARDSNRIAVEGLLFAEEQGIDIITIVLAKPPPQQKSAIADEDLQAVNAEGAPQIRRVVLQRPPSGLGMALGPAQAPGGGPAIAFLAGNGPKVLRGQIKPGDEVVAVDGKSVLGVPLEASITALNGVRDVFELLIREGLPPFVHPPQLDDASMNDASIWSAVEHSLDVHAQHEEVGVDASGRLEKVQDLGGGPRSRSGCGLVRLFRDDGGLGFSVLGGIDVEMHGVFVTRVAPNSPASGKLAPGDMLLVANGATLFDVTHADAVEALNAVNPGDSLDLAIYRNDRVPMWRSSQRLRNMFGIVSFIEPGDSLGINIGGGVDSKIGHIEVQQVKPDSAAATVGNLFPGDHLIAINGNVLIGKTHEEATNVLKQTGALATFLVQRDPSLSGTARGDQTHMRAFKIRKGSRPGSREEDFGIQLASRRRGTVVQFVVRGVAPNHSSQPEAHLQVGDEIIAIDDQPLAEKTHAEVVDLLKALPPNQHVTFVTRRLGLSDAVEMTVTISRKRVQDDFGFGFTLGTSSDGNEEMFVSNVEDNGLCHDRLQIGDTIISINGRKTAQMAHAEKITLIDRETQCELVLRRLSPPGAARPSQRTADTRYAETAGAAYERNRPTNTEPQEYNNIKTSVVTVVRQEKRGFGFTIGSNADNAVKVITAVKEYSSAYGLVFKGDMVVSINGVLLTGMPQKEMEQMVRAASSLELMLEREVELVEVDIARDETSGTFGFSVASTDDGIFSARGIEPLSPASGKLHHGDRFVRINAVDTANLATQEAAMEQISGVNQLRLVVERPIDTDIINTSLDAGGPPIYPDSAINAESAAGDDGFSLDDDGNANEDDQSGMNEGEAPRGISRRRSSTTFVWTKPKVVPTGPTVIKTVTLVRDPARGFGFNFDTDEHLNHNDLGLGVSIESHIHEDELHHISGTREGTPAFGKLFIGDLIDSINGVNAKETSHDDILDMLAGLDTIEIMVERAPTNTIHISLERHEGDGGFGFSLVPRGAGQPLLVKAIQRGSPADGKVRVGDILDTLNGTNTAMLSNDEAKSMVINANALEIELHRRNDAKASGPDEGSAKGALASVAEPAPAPSTKTSRRAVDYPEEAGNGYEAACAFATRIFHAANARGLGACSEAEVKDYCNACPEDKARLVGEIFTWDDFFAGMGAADELFDLTKFIAGVVKAFAVAGGSSLVGEPETPLPVAPGTVAQGGFDGSTDDADGGEFAATAATVVSAAAGGGDSNMPEPPEDAPPPPPSSPPSNFTSSPGGFARGMSQRLENASNRLSSFDGGGYTEDDYTLHREYRDSVENVASFEAGMTSVVTIQKQNGALGFSIKAAENGLGVVVDQVQPGGAADTAAGSSLQNGCKLLEVNGVNVDIFSVEELKAELARHVDAVTIVYQPAAADTANNRLTVHMSDM